MIRTFPLPKGGGPIEAGRLAVVGGGCHGGFHYRKAVAPLKRCTQPRDRVVYARFHYRKAVAPLKLLRGSGTHNCPGEFPLPKGGGPIEARCSSIIRSPSVRFPLPKGGGPIEADAMYRLVLQRDHRFHYRKAVAPLKHLPQQDVLQRAIPFPLPKGGGPIEARSASSPPSWRTTVSTTERRWPH